MYGLFTFIWLILWKMQVDRAYIECLDGLVYFTYLRDLQPTYLYVFPAECRHFKGPSPQQALTRLQASFPDPLRPDKHEDQHNISDDE